MHLNACACSHPHPTLTASPTTCCPALQYDAFLAAHGAARQHRSLGEYERRRSLFHANAQLIQEHNAAGHSFSLAMNRQVVHAVLCSRTAVLSQVVAPCMRLLLLKL